MSEKLISSLAEGLASSGQEEALRRLHLATQRKELDLISAPTITTYPDMNFGLQVGVLSEEQQIHSLEAKLRSGGRDLRVLGRWSTTTDGVEEQSWPIGINLDEFRVDLQRIPTDTGAFYLLTMAEEMGSEPSETTLVSQIPAAEALTLLRAVVNSRDLRISGESSLEIKDNPATIVTAREVLRAVEQLATSTYTEQIIDLDHEISHDLIYAAKLEPSENVKAVTSDLRAAGIRAIATLEQPSHLIVLLRVDGSSISAAQEVLAERLLGRLSDSPPG